MLTHLSIYHLRNLQAVSIDVAQCNVFIGANGSGKTSLLESLHLLSRGKSFRHAQPKRYISHHYPHVTVHAKFADGDSMAIQKAQDASTVMRLGQQTVYTQSPLTKRLPTLLVDPSSMDILEIGSSSRRQLLDWITFHVKPGFHPQWLAYQRLLKQRNALLKQSKSLSVSQKRELAAWDEGLAIHADLITHYRREVFEAWKPRFEALVEKLLPDYAPFIQLRFLPGYNTEVALNELLQQRVAQDNQMGYTRIGCHRSDVQVLWVDDKAAREKSETKQSSHITDFDEIQHRGLNQPLSAPENALYSETQSSGSQANGSQTSNDGVSETTYIDLSTDTTLDDDSTFHSEGTVREQAANVLSRGEKKLLITALRLSQLPLLMNSHDLPQSYRVSPKSIHSNPNSVSVDGSTLHSGAHFNSPIAAMPSASNNDISDSALPLVLLDDITAELDERALTILLDTLSQLSCQVFITSLDTTIVDLLKKYWATIQMFHVEQGRIFPN